LPFSADIYAEKYLKELMGNTDIKDALQRLDKLTQEEARMANAEHLRIVHNVEGRMIRVSEGVQDVGRGVQDVGDRVKGVHHEVQDVDKKVQDVRDTVQDVSDGIQDVRNSFQDVGEGVQGVQQAVQDVDDKVDQLNRESSNAIALDLQPSQIFTGNHLRSCLQTWLSPPNPSTNHNIACDAQHKGTAQWFLRGTIFNQWKSTGSLLWIYGKCVFVLSFSMSSGLIISDPTVGSGKSILWFVLHYHVPLGGTYIVMQLSNHTRYHGFARLWKCVHRIFLLRL